MSDPRRAERVLDTLIEQVVQDDDYRECRQYLAELRRKAAAWDAWCQFAHEHGGVHRVEFFDGGGLVCEAPPPPWAPCTCGLPEREHCVPVVEPAGTGRSGR